MLGSGVLSWDPLVVAERQDWPGLPPDADLVSLWPVMHDAVLIGVELQPDERRAAVIVESRHVNEHHALGAQYRFRLQLEGVVETSARGRAWRDVAAAAPDQNDDENEVEGADLARVAATIMVRFGVLLNHGTDYTDLFATATRVEICGSDGREYTVDELVKMGEEYWDAWQAR